MKPGALASAMAQLSVEDLAKALDHLSPPTTTMRIIVSRLAPPDTCARLPDRYDPTLRRDVTLVILGTATWEAIRQSTPTTEDTDPAIPRLFGVPVEFRP